MAERPLPLLLNDNRTWSSFRRAGQRPSLRLACFSIWGVRYTSVEDLDDGLLEELDDLLDGVRLDFFDDIFVVGR